MTEVGQETLFWIVSLHLFLPKHVTWQWLNLEPNSCVVFFKERGYKGHSNKCVGVMYKHCSVICWTKSCSAQHCYLIFFKFIVFFMIDTSNEISSNFHVSTVKIFSSPPWGKNWFLTIGSKTCSSQATFLRQRKDRYWYFICWCSCKNCFVLKAESYYDKFINLALDAWVLILEGYFVGLLEILAVNIVNYCLVSPYIMWCNELNFLECACAVRI